MKLLSRERQGEAFILSCALLWSLFPVITILTFSGLTPLYSAGFSTLIAAIFFAGMLIVRHEWRGSLSRQTWMDIFLTAFFIGILYFAFYFIGLKHTTAGNGAIIALMEVFFSFLILGVFLKHEPITSTKLCGAFAMIAGAAIILFPKVAVLHGGDFLILLGTISSPIGNIYAQRARKHVSTDFLMFYRSLISGVLLLLLGMIFEPIPSTQMIQQSSSFLVINGIVLMGLSKILWVESIHRISITKAVSLSSVSPAFTLPIAYFVLHESISFFQIAGLIPIMVGAFLLTRRV